MTLGTEIDTGILPAPDANTIYRLYYPPDSMITNLAGGLSCEAFDGYHLLVHAARARAQWWRTPCSPTADPTATDPGLTELQTIEVASSHELIEAATDPNYITTSPGWKISDPTSPWFGLDGEVGDQCEFLTTYYVDPTSTYYAQRIWSNSAALTNGSPCIPFPTVAADATPFFAESIETGLPVLSAGDSATFTVQAWSTSTAPTWTAYLFEQRSPGSATVTVSPTSVTLNNGETGTFTVSMPSSASADRGLRGAHRDAVPGVGPGRHDVLAARAGRSLARFPGDPSGVTGCGPAFRGGCVRTLYWLGSVALVVSCGASPLGGSRRAVLPHTQHQAIVGGTLDTGDPSVIELFYIAAFPPADCGGDAYLPEHLLRRADREDLLPRRQLLVRRRRHLLERAHWAAHVGHRRPPRRSHCRRRDLG